MNMSSEFYGTIGLCWDTGSLGSAEWEYYRRCEEGLLRLNDAVDWSTLATVLDFEGDNAEDDDEDIEVEDSDEDSAK